MNTALTWWKSEVQVLYRQNDRFDRMMTDWTDWLSNEFFFHAMRTGEIVLPFRDVEYVSEAKDAIDFWAVNYYTREIIDSRKTSGRGKRFRHKSVKMIDMDFYLEEMYPEGLVANLERLADKPIYITENGCSCDDDRLRIIYIALNLCALHEAIDRGLDVRGYFYWSLMDNFEWGSFIPRFGLVDVDFDTFKRTPKPSSHFFREIIERNGVTQAMLSEYLPDMPRMTTYGT